MRILQFSTLQTWLFCLLCLSSFLVNQARGEESSTTITPSTVFSYCEEMGKELLQEFPNTPEPYSALGYVYYRGKKYHEAIQSFQKSLNLKPNQPLIVHMIAFLYGSLNENDKAIEWYQKTLQMEPDAPHANERLGSIYQKLNRSDEAVKAFEQEIKYSPQNASARIYLGEQYLVLNRLKEAEEQATLAMQNDPRLPEPLYLLARIYRKQGQTAKATDILKTFQEKKKEEQVYLEKNDPILSDTQQAIQAAIQTHQDVGTIYFGHRKDAKAEEHFKQALSLDPQNVEIRYNLAILYQQNNLFDKAIVLYKEILDLKPNDIQCLLGAGLILSTQKRFSEARSYMEKVLVSEPDNLTAKRALARILLSSENQEPQRVLQILESIPQKEMLAMDYDMLGWAYYINGKFDESLNALHTAVVMEPNNAQYRQRYEKLSSKLSSR